MKTGFALIEVIIATAIASMLSVALFLSWGQVQRVVVKADDIMSYFDRMMLAQTQFERDFMGMCLPLSRPYLKPDEKEEAANQEKKEAPKDGQKKEKPKRVERVFYAQSKGNLFESMTCLTNNPLDVYWSDRAGSARPRIARIQYRLEQDAKTEKNPSYTLYRQESYTLDLDRFAKESEKAIRSYALITGIKELKLIYWQEIEVEKEVKEDEKTTKKKDKEIKKVTEWDLDKEPAPKNTFIRPIPIMITVELTLWDLQKKKSRPFTFMISIPIAIENPADTKTKNTPAKPQPPTQPQTPPSQEQAAQPQGALPAAAGVGALPLKMLSGGQNNVAINVDTSGVVTKIDKGSALKELLKNEKGIGEKKP